MPTTICYVNGQLIDSDNASVSVFDHGFTVADGVFETLKIKHGVVFAVNRHLNRLENSCKGLGIRFPGSALVAQAINQVANANSKLAIGRLRITVTSGIGPLGSDRANSEPTLIVSVAEQNAWPQSSSLLLVPWIRNEKSPLVSLKTTSYAENVYALGIAKQFGFDEAVFLNSHGFLTEGTGSNIFLVKDDIIYTPSPDSGLLKGVTRDLVIEWAGDKYSIIESKISKNDLFDAQEVFITSTTRDVHPVNRIASLGMSSTIDEDKQFQIGKNTQEIAQIFAVKSELAINP